MSEIKLTLNPTPAAPDASAALDPEAAIAAAETAVQEAQAQQAENPVTPPAPTATATATAAQDTPVNQTFTPEELGFEPAKPEELVAGASEEQAAEIFDSVLENRALPAQKNIVLANAAFAIQVMEKGQKSLEDCIEAARESIDSGRALATFRKFAKLNS